MQRWSWKRRIKGGIIDVKENCCRVCSPAVNGCTHCERIIISLTTPERACGNNLIFGGEELGSLIGKTLGILKKPNFYLLLNISILNSCDSLYLFAVYLRIETASPFPLLWVLTALFHCSVETKFWHHLAPKTAMDGLYPFSKFYLAANSTFRFLFHSLWI